MVCLCTFSFCFEEGGRRIVAVFFNYLFLILRAKMCNFGIFVN